MSRSCDLRSSLRLGLPWTVTPPRPGTMDAKQSGRLVRAENDAELGQHCTDHCAATLTRAISSDPCSQRLGLRSAQLRPASRTLQRSFQAVRCSVVQPTTERLSGDADALRCNLDRRSVADRREGEQTLTTQSVALALSSVAQFISSLRKSYDPTAPAPGSSWRRSICPRQDHAQPVADLGGQVGHTSEQAIEPRGVQNRDSGRQACREVLEQPGNDRQSAVVRGPHNIIVFAKAEVVSDASKQPVAVPSRDVDPDHAEKHIDQCHRGRPVERANAGELCSVQLLARDKEFLKSQRRLMRAVARDACERCAASPADAWVNRSASIKTRGVEYAITRRTTSRQDGPMLRADARPSVHPEQSQIASPVFSKALRTNIHPAVTWIARQGQGGAVPAAEPLRGLVVAGARRADERHRCKCMRADAGPFCNPRQRFGGRTTPPFRIDIGVDAKSHAVQRQRRQSQSSAQSQNPGCQGLTVLRSNVHGQESSRRRSWRQRRDGKQIRSQHVYARRAG
ncbi:hypothetical protein ACVWXQ_000309 [Bradyrhizobium sp. S3.14.4]